MLISATVSLASMISTFGLSPLSGDAALTVPAPITALADEAKKEPAPPVPPVVAATPSPLEALLDKIEAKSRETKTLAAEVNFTTNQILEGDVQIRKGKMIYIAGPPAKFGVHFSGKVAGGVIRDENRWYIFDGAWLVEKLGDKKQFFKWQVVPPNANAAVANPLALGRGPFVVPVSFDKKLVMARYDVSVAAPDEKADPRNSVRLKLVPKKDQRMNFTELELWYDKETMLPIKARTMNASQTESVFELSKVAFNEKVDEKLLDTAEPKEKGWEVQITPWEGPAKEK